MCVCVCVCVCVREREGVFIVFTCHNEAEYGVIVQLILCLVHTCIYGRIQEQKI